MKRNNHDLLHVIHAFADQKVLVLGDAMLDGYLRGTSRRLCQEAPVPIVDIHESVFVPGGAANTAVNVRALSAQVQFLSVIGQDDEGSRLLTALEQHDVSTENIIVSPTRRTLAKQRILAGAQIVVRFDQGSTSLMDEETEELFLSRLGTLFQDCNALVISDYGYGVITPRVLQALEELQQRHSRLVMIDSKRLDTYRDLRPTAVKLNYEETLHLLGLERVANDHQRIEQVREHGQETLQQTGAQIAAITLDHQGALIFHTNDDVPYRTYAKPHSNSQAAGAGDTFMSALAVSLAAGATVVEHAAEIASAASSIVVSKSGTAACSSDELIAHFSAHEKFLTGDFQLALQVAFHHKSGRRIVFTNGCFDILHRGHIAYLNRAKALGDILIVGLNSDAGIRKLKGPDRPINTLEDRAQILAALSCVDHIVSFENETPHELIARIKPDVFVKGGDYTRETLPEAALVEELGGRIEILPYLETYSTTSVIEKIRSQRLQNQQEAL